MEAAQQGEPKAITTLLNRSLQSQGVTAKTIRKNDCLQILLESAQIPDKDDLVPFVYKQINNLGIASIQKLKIYGRQLGEKDPVWQEEIELGINNDYLISELENVMAEDSAYNYADQSDINQEPNQIFEVDVPMPKDNFDNEDMPEEYSEDTEEEEMADAVEEKPKLALSKPLLIALIAVIVLGIGAAAYLNWPTITALLPFLGGGDQPATPPAPATPIAAAPAPVNAPANAPAAKTPAPIAAAPANAPAAKTPAPIAAAPANAPAAKTPAPTAAAPANAPAAKTPADTAPTNTPAAKTPAPKTETNKANTGAANPKFREGVNKAINAAELTQTAQTKNEWNNVATQWQQAIELMKAVPKDSPNYALAQDRITMYQRNLEYAQKNAENSL